MLSINVLPSTNEKMTSGLMELISIPNGVFIKFFITLGFGLFPKVMKCLRIKEHSHFMAVRLIL